MSNDFDLSNMEWVFDKPALARLLAAIKSCQEVVIDLETTGLDEHATRKSEGGVPARIVLASLTLASSDSSVDNPPTTWVVPLSHPDSPWLGSWRKVIWAITKTIKGSEKSGIKHDKVDDDLFRNKGVYGKSWHITAQGYVAWSRGENGHTFAHTEIAKRALGPCPDGMTVDHINRDRLDNRRKNLRYLTRAQQMQNRAGWGGSGVKGVYWHERLNKYEAAVTLNGKRHYLGVFSIMSEAEKAVQDFKRDNGLLEITAPDGKPCIGHNLKFDIKWLYAHTGVDLSELIAWDTQIGSHLMDETTSTRLKERASVIFDVERWDDFSLASPGAAERVPLFDLGTYAARDTHYSWCLADYQRRVMRLHNDTRHDEVLCSEDVENARLGKLATWCAMPTTSTLTAIEQRGMRLDIDWTQEHLADYVRTSDDLKDELSQRYDGIDPRECSFAPTSKWFTAWTQKAIDAGDLRVTAFTATGKPQWNKGALLRQARLGSQVAQDLLTYRAAMKKAEYLRSWLSVVTPDGFIHSTYHAGRVITGRLSCSNINVQQVTKELKPGFVPSTPDKVILDFDYSQIELRMAAFISRCPAMIEAFQRGQDLHVMVASRITQKDLSEVTRTERQYGKACIAHGQMVTTPRGLVPIQDVLLTDKVWDGSQWVTHGGVIYQGEREVITYAGLTATPDHLIALSDGSMEGFGHAAGAGKRLASSGGPESPFIPGAYDSSVNPWQGALTNRAFSKVYDLLDCGPRHRFTVSGTVVHNCNFGLLYQMGPSGFQTYAETVYDISFTIEEAQRIHQAFYDQWVGIGPWHKRAIAKAKSTGQVSSPIGRVRRLPDIRDGNPRLAAYAERASINAPVQGFGSDIMQIAASLISGTIPGSTAVKGAHLIGTVHDSILVEVPADRWKEVGEQCLDRMINVHPVLRKMDCHLDVPLAVEGQAGTRWGWSDVGTDLSGSN